MPDHIKKYRNRPSSTMPIGLGQADLRKTLLGQDSHMRGHFKRVMLYLSIAIVVVAVHQGFILISYPVSNWHALVHNALLAITVALAVGTWFTWSSYLKCHRYQHAVLDAYAVSEEVGEKTGENLRKSESLLESLFGAITDRILVIDPSNRIVKANKVAANWAGHDPTHHEFNDIFPTCGSQGERRNELSLIESTRETQKTQRGRRLRGGVDCSMLLSVDTYPVSPSESDPGLVIAVARDVTEQTGHELASRHREKMAALGLLVAGFAHDLGNPLASLSSELELLREEDPEKIRASLDKVSEHVERIKRKLRDIVQFAHRPDENKQDVDIHEAIDHALKLTRYDPRARRIHFSIEANNDVPPVQMREDDLVLALINIIVNAFDAMPQDGTLTINAGMSPTGDALLTISDTGVGMDAATLQQATQPLFTTKDAGEADGTGLGLTMVEKLIDSAGGELTLASEPGRGTRVMLRLPLVEIDYPRVKRNAS